VMSTLAFLPDLYLERAGDLVTRAAAALALDVFDRGCR